MALPTLIAYAMTFALTTAEIAVQPVPEEYSETWVWRPGRGTTGHQNVAANSSYVFHNSDIVVVPFGALDAAGLSLPWQTGFDPVRDNPTTTTYVNDTSVPVNIEYNNLACTGNDRFIGKTTGNHYYRDRTLDLYTVKGS